MIFGSPGAAFAIYRCARPEQRKVVGGLMISAALTSMLTGITEPLEFTFLFIAPGLYGIHCVFAGLAYMMMHVLKITVGLTFSGRAHRSVLFWNHARTKKNKLDDGHSTGNCLFHSVLFLIPFSDLEI